ncbi:ABC-2 transporter permease [Clostridium sp.]|uniref:ABC-2 transporter permease n=1 Tax=Clostridium sp. TaxID=1506 RepID=UPI00346456C7
MKALILKDLNLAKTTWKAILIFSLVYPAVFSSGNGITKANMFRYIAFMIYMLAYSYIFYHEYKSMDFVNSLPANRFKIVCGRYISLMILAVLCIIIVLFAQEILGRIGIRVFSIYEINSTFIFENFLVLIIWSTLMTPFIIGFGLDLGKTIQKLFMMIAIMAMTMVIYNMDDSAYERINLYVNNILGENYKVMILTGAFILYIISMVISIYIYDRKEF